MKSTIAFIFLLFSISAFSQQNKWDIGIVGGTGITTLRQPNFEGNKANPALGFYTGFSAQYNFNQHFALHTELAFDQKGTKNESTLTAPDGTVFVKYTRINQLNYLTMPILFRASMGNKIKYFSQAGPYLSYLLNQTIKYSSSTSEDPIFNSTTNTTSNLPNMDFGISAGLGVLFPIKEKVSISCEVRGNYGLIDLSGKSMSAIEIKEFNESLNFIVGINYKLSK